MKDLSETENYEELHEERLRRREENNRKIQIKFSVTGTCSQTILLNEDCPFTRDQIVAALKNGQGNISLATSIHEKADLIQFGSEFPDGMRVLGEIVDSSVDGEFSDFERDDDSVSDS